MITTTNNGSAVHLATNGQATAWEGSDGQVYIAHAKPTAFLPSGLPANCRWECSRKHWDRYFETVHKPAGWRAVR